MRTIYAKRNKPLIIGWQGENEATQVQFDVSGWKDTFGTGTFSLLNQRPTETIGYPCTVTEADGIVTWVVKDVDVAKEGTGHVQLTYTVGDQLAKSEQFFTLIRKSINVSETPPEPYPDWFADVMQAVNEATQTAQECLDSVVVATNAQIDSALYS